MSDARKGCCQQCGKRTGCMDQYKCDACRDAESELRRRAIGVEVPEDVHMQARGSPPGCGVVTECGLIVCHPDELRTVVPQRRGPVTCPKCLAAIDGHVKPKTGATNGLTRYRGWSTRAPVRLELRFNAGCCR